jgi:hypothetical protein
MEGGDGGRKCMNCQCIPFCLQNVHKFALMDLTMQILAKVVEDLGKLGKDLTKQDYIIIVGRPGNSLDRDYYYPIEKDVNFIAERTVHTNVGCQPVSETRQAVDEWESY